MAAAFEVLTTPSLKKAYENNEDFTAPDYTN